MIRKIFFRIAGCLIMLLLTVQAFPQALLRGTVTEAGTGKPVPMAAVLTAGGAGTVTAADGTFTVDVRQTGKVTVTVSCLGYRSVTREVEVISGTGGTLNVELQVDYFSGDEVTVTATRSETAVRSVPARINMLGRAVIASVPAATTDELLWLTPGLNVSRSFGIFSHRSSVTMRGLSGNEQGRVLVMINGVPVNKSDGGSVNWNMINTDVIERIEVVKGPGSSLYGGNAMGGAINIITLKPVEKFSGNATLGYGTYNTPYGSFALSGRDGGREGKLYWMLNGFYRKSDGYITQSEADRLVNPYITKSEMEEMGLGLKTGCDFNARNSIEADLLWYDDYRGTGEVINRPRGNTTDHDTWQARVMYNGNSGDLSWKVNLFSSVEYYRKVNEFMKDDYTWYEVLSKRGDLGILSSGTWQTPGAGKLTFGFDLRNGSVDADDVYYTSTDIVTNRGRMNIAGLFLQDELSLAEGRFRLTGALRFDYAAFYDGAFTITAPTGETTFMYNLADPSLEEVRWTALSPKFSALWLPGENSRVYVSYARGFRQPVLDELCRSGRVRGGFKLANPSLGPETLDNFEIGADVRAGNKFNVSLSVYYSSGSDFMYYVNTGDSIDMGFGLRPVLSRQNISGISVTGAETELVYRPFERITITGVYAFNQSIITDFEAGENSESDLTGNYLTDVPFHTGSVRMAWTAGRGSLSVMTRYTGPAWANDLNAFDEIIGADRYPGYLTTDVRGTVRFRSVTASLGIQNLLNKLYYDSKGAVCPGRFITFETSVKF